MPEGVTIQSGIANNGMIPIGGIIMWSGTIATIPTNWQLCNGTNGTPDLRDKFLVGATADNGGVAKTNLTGSLTQSGGAVSHHHADHVFTQPGAHSNHTFTQPGDHAAHTHSVTSNVTLTDHANHTHTGPSHQHNLTGGAATAHGHTYTEVPNHVHPQNAPSSASGGAILYALDTNASGSTSAGISTANNTSGVVSGTTANNTTGATDNAGTGASGNESAALSHSVTNNAVTSGNPSATLTHSGGAVDAHSAHGGGAVDAHDTLSAPQPYYALAFIQRMA